MSRHCMITGKKVMFGNNVSHANNKTRRRFNANIQDKSVYSKALDKMIRLRISTAGMRTLEHKGGIDAFLKGTAKTKLDPALRQYKAQVEAAAAE